MDSLPAVNKTKVEIYSYKQADTFCPALPFKDFSQLFQRVFALYLD
jgi:hypothetical protein